MTIVTATDIYGDFMTDTPVLRAGIDFLTESPPPQALGAGIIPPFPLTGEDTKVQSSCHLSRAAGLVLGRAGIHPEVLLAVP